MMGRTLYDVSQLLESADQADQRMRRVLELLADLVPYEQCALLEARLGHDPRIVLVPEPSGEERASLARALVDVFGQLVDANARGRGVSGAEARLAVPLVGLDEVIGILLVRSSAMEYTEEHLRALSVIAAKLAAYITIRGASADLADLARERDEARRAVEAARDAKDELLQLVSAERSTPHPTTGDGASHELAQEIQAQAQRLDELLGRAHLASAELRLTLRKVVPGLAGEEPTSLGSKRRGQLG